MIRFRSAALCVALLAGGAAVAAAQNTERPDSARSGEARRGGARRDAMRGLMRGIELTEAQRTRIKAIHDSYLPQRQEMQKSMREARASRQRPDSASLQRWRDLATRERNEMRAVLTAEQQRAFDRNSQKASERMKNRRGGNKARGERGVRHRGAQPSRAGA